MRRATGVSDAVKDFLAFVKTTLGEAVADVRASDRLTDSAVCLVAPDFGPDRALERILAGSGRLSSASKPILEVNPRHETVAALAALGDGEQAFKQDAVHLLLDEARVLDGERPADARLFSDRLGRVLERSLGKGRRLALRLGSAVQLLAGADLMRPQIRGYVHRRVFVGGLEIGLGALEPEVDLRADQDRA